MTLRIAITPGEPAGVGPDLAVTLAQYENKNELVFVADPELLKQRASHLGLPLKLREVNFNISPEPSKQGEIVYSPISLVEPHQIGTLNPANSHYVLNTLDAAISHCKSQHCAAMVTGPVHKGVINDAELSPERLLGMPLFQGHTEYLAKACGIDTVVMMLATQKLRVALATTHLPLRQVADAISFDGLQTTLRILHHALINQFGIAEPTILVCGLNPHAGEGGHLGTEEQDTIEPVLDSLRKDGMQLIGPLPADTLFTPSVLAKADAVLAMYHDQGLPVLKFQGFGNAVNITLGLPIIRTSVDHGTALDIAGTGKANTGSLETAIQYAGQMASTLL